MILVKGLAVAGALALGGTAWMVHQPRWSDWSALRAHPYFAVRSVAVRGAGPLLGERAILDWLGLHDGANVWDASPVAVRERLEEHPMIAHAEVRRELPGRYEITVRERRPEAIVVLDGLYYLDRSGKAFGPIDAEHDHDYPVITGVTAGQAPGARAWALRRVLRLARLCARRGCFGGISEIRLDPERGPVLYPTAPAVPVILGWGSWRVKLERAAQAVAAWPEGADRLTSVDVRFRNQVVVKSVPPVNDIKAPAKRRGVRI